ncbi:MAG: ABC transporter permease, partial [FCB group bacterium]|nr:ABC transporter permease [FCB group bacterium]
MRFEAFVAQRYLRSKRRNRFVSLITVISIAGVSVGVTALIVVLSVMTGFDIALQAAIIGNRAHIVIQDPAGSIMNHEEIQQRLVRDFPGVVAAAPMIQVEALIETEATLMGKRSTGGLVLGVDPEEESKVTLLSENLEQSRGRPSARGTLPTYKEIVLGYLLADRLGVGVGDRI